MNLYNNNESMSEGHYEDNLRHMAEPADPSDREEAVSTTVSDVEALYLANLLREWAGYHADDDERPVALGYAQFIDRQVRQNGKRDVRLYAHTSKAAETLNACIEDYLHFYEEQTYKDIYCKLSNALIDLWGRHYAETVNKDAGREMYEEAPNAEDIELSE